jgi:hypothetical protein
MATPTMLQLEEQYKGRTTAEFIIYSYKDAKNKTEAALRVIGLKENITASGLTDDFNNFMKEEIVHFLWGKDFWKRDAGLYAYSFYDFFILGYGDKFMSPPSEEEIFEIFNCVTYSIVLMMYDDNNLYQHVKKSGKKFRLF